MRFQWDPRKDRANQAKHGLSFKQASQLFKDNAEYLEIYDEEHSDDEDRFIAIGNVLIGTIVVVFTEPEDHVVRILSARRTTRKERERLEAYGRGEK